MNGTVGDIDLQDWAARLVAVGQSRDVDAFEALFRFYAPRIRAYMMRQLRDAQAAEELTQETMMTVWNKASLFDPERGNPDAWIFTVARNLRISALRKARRPEFDPSDPAFVAEDMPAAAEDYERQQEAQRLHNALKGLPKEQLELLRHSFFDETPHRVIAEKLGLPLGTVKSRIRMAFGKLRAALEDHR